MTAMRDRRLVYPDIPSEVICPECERTVKVIRGNFEFHSTFPTGPRCAKSGEPVTDEAVINTGHVKRMNQVLSWAEMMRNEDPAYVHGWVQSMSRAELEAMMLTALVAVPADSTLESAFGWVRELDTSR